MPSPLLLLPLDDRPVNLAVPRLLARVAGEALRCPPPALLGRFLTPGDTDALARWLGRNAGSARAAIVSLDMLAYGGLVASRAPVVGVDEAVARVNLLREVKARAPRLRLFAFNVIMRLTITGADAVTRAAGREIFRYSVLRDQAERLGDGAARAELNAVTARIPPGLLQAYLTARRRNHAVNRAALALVADGVIDFLALVQEDTAPAGLHVAEQQALAAEAAARVDPACWRLYPGTDEAGQTLLARYLLREAGQPFPVRIVPRDAEAAAHPALFEDVPLIEGARRHVDAVGGTVGEAGLTLALHTFTPPQPDLFEMPPLPTPRWETALATYPPSNAPSWLAGLPTPLAVADVAYCNGGDPWLLDALLGDGRFLDLHAYAGWNTAGNTLGTTLAHAGLRALALARGATAVMEAAHRTALWTRLLDDGVYQPLVRAWASGRAQEIGASPLNLAEMASRVEMDVDAAMHQAWHDLLERYPAPRALDRPFRARLPWGRIFEVAPEMIHDKGNR